MNDKINQPVKQVLPRKDHVKFPTREAWLEAAVVAVTPLFKGAGLEVPPLHVSTGFPSRGATSRKKLTIGQCWDKKQSSDNIAHVFISPLLSEPVGTQGVLPTLVHEIIHASLGCKCGHGAPFKKAMKGVLLEGKATSTVASADLIVRLDAIVADTLGDYPHGALNLDGEKDKKPQSTRMIKCECGAEDCGYTVRTTRKWLKEAGAPFCPRSGHGKLQFDPALLEEDSNDEGGDE